MSGHGISVSVSFMIADESDESLDDIWTGLDTALRAAAQDYIDQHPTQFRVKEPI